MVSICHPATTKLVVIYVKKIREVVGGGGAARVGVKHSDDDCISKYIAAVHHLRNLKLDKKLLLGEEEEEEEVCLGGGVERKTSKGNFETENCKNKKKDEKN